MDVAFADYLAKADLTAYAVINPNSRAISISSTKDTDGDGYTDIEEIKQGTDPANAASYPAGAKAADPGKQAAPLVNTPKQTKQVAVHVAKTFTKDPAVKELPQTGSESAVALSLVGMFLGFFGLAGIKKSHKED